MRRYRERLAELEASLGPRPSQEERWSSPRAGEWLTLDHQAQRLAVYDRDVDAIVRTHAREERAAAWLQDTTEALAEIGEIDFAIEWARRAVDFPDGGHQAQAAARYWCELLAKHRQGELLGARWTVFRRWPSSSTAAGLYRAAGPDWPRCSGEVIDALASRPRDAVLFAQLTLHDLPLAWELAQSLGLDDDRTWRDLAKAYEKVDPLAVLPVYERLVRNELAIADAANYRDAARRLARMRRLTVGTPVADEVDSLVAEPRETYRRRPRLREEFTRAGLP